MREYTNYLRNIFVFQGRTRRREYWVVSLINSAISTLLYAILCFACTAANDPLFYTGNSRAGFTTSGSTIGTILAIPLALWGIFTLVSMIGLTVRRFHDAGVPGWILPICYVGICLCGLGAIALFVICLIPSRDDNQYGENPKTANPDMYADSSGIIVSVIAYILGVMLLTVGMVTNIHNCGLRAGEDDIRIDLETPENLPEDATEEFFHTEDTEAFDVSEQGPAEDGSYHIRVGEYDVSLIPPENAEQVTAYDSFLSYNVDGILVTYADSFSSTEEDALKLQESSYQITRDVYGEELDVEQTITPKILEVNGHEASAYKVATLSDDWQTETWEFLVDIGTDHYLAVTIQTTNESLSEEDAIQIADIGV